MLWTVPGQSTLGSLACTRTPCRTFPSASSAPRSSWGSGGTPGNSTSARSRKATVLSSSPPRASCCTSSSLPLPLPLAVRCCLLLLRRHFASNFSHNNSSSKVQIQRDPPLFFSASANLLLFAVHGMPMDYRCVLLFVYVPEKTAAGAHASHK